MAGSQGQSNGFREELCPTLKTVYRKIFAGDARPPSPFSEGQ